MRIRRTALGGGFLLVWQWCLLAASSPASDSGAERRFFKERPSLQFIEQRLGASATIVVPPDFESEKHVATDLELRAAFASVLDDFLAPPSTSANKAGGLIAEVCGYRPAQTAQWIAVVTDSILKYSLSTADKDLNDAAAAAIAINPREAGAVVRMVIHRIVAGIDAGAFRAAEKLDRDAAARAAGRIVLTCIRSVKSVPEVANIVEQALDEAFVEAANDFVIEIMAAAVKGGKDIEGFGVSGLAKLAFTRYGQSKLRAGTICAGLIKEAGPEAASMIKDEAALALPVTLAAYATVVCNAYVAVASSPDAVAFEVSRFITVSNVDYVPAVMIGAMAAAPRSAAEILQAGLNRDLVLHGRTTTRDIVEAAVVACESAAPELAGAAVDHGDPQEGNAPALIAEGLALGTPVSRIGAALAAQIQMQEKNSEVMKATVAGAVAGVVAAEKFRALSAIAFTAAADPRFAGDVLDQIVISAPRALQYAGVLGVLAARPEQASTLLERALKHPDLDASQAGPIAAGGAVIMGIQETPAGFFRATRKRLDELDQASPSTVDAIVLGASLANPRGASAVTALAAGASAQGPIAIALQGDPGSLAQIEMAAESAIHVKGDPDNLFRYVRTQIAATPDLAAEIVTGAMAAAPSLGHVIGHAAAVASPAVVTKIVPRIFAFSPDVDSSETFVALTGGVVHGVLEAKLDSSAERDFVAEAVAVSIRSVVALRRGHVASGAVVPEGEAIAAVVSAAAGAAPSHAIEIAKVAARTMQTLSCPASDQGRIKGAVLAACPAADAPKIADAIAAGVAEADRQVPAAGVKALLDYSHDSLTGRSMTNFRDL